MQEKTAVFDYLPWKKPLLQLVLVLSIFLFAGEVQAAFNKHEIKLISEKIESTFQILIDTWKEELYFEMYDFGQRKSRKHLSRGEFAQRMVDLKWKPTLKAIKIDRIDILYHSYAVIYFWQQFEHKVNSLNRIEKYMIFPIILETNQWKFDLTQLIRIPYEGKFKAPQSSAPQKLTEKQKPQSTAESTEPDNQAAGN